MVPDVSISELSGATTTEAQVNTMSAELCLSPGPGGNNGSPQNTTTTTTTSTGGTKPLHRFIKGQPKIIGIIVLVLGTSVFTVTAVLVEERDTRFIWTAIPPGFVQGTLYIICGILYILTEHTPTKKTVTISLALSIVSLLATIWTILHVLPNLVHGYYWHLLRHSDLLEENVTESDLIATLQYMSMEKSLEIIFVVKFFSGGIIFIVMSVLGGIALRSTSSQAIVIMTSAPRETQAE